MIVNSLAGSSFSSCFSCLPKYLFTEMLEVTVIWRTCFTLWWHHYWRISLWKSIPILLRFIRTGSINRKQKLVLPGNNDCDYLFLCNALCITLHLIWGGNCNCFFFKLTPLMVHVQPGKTPRWMLLCWFLVLVCCTKVSLWRWITVLCPCTLNLIWVDSIYMMYIGVSEMGLRLIRSSQRHRGVTVYCMKFWFCVGLLLWLVILFIIAQWCLSTLEWAYGMPYKQRIRLYAICATIVFQLQETGVLTAKHWIF